jgi:hypothetical protein
MIPIEWLPVITMHCTIFVMFYNKTKPKRLLILKPDKLDFTVSNNKTMLF